MEREEIKYNIADLKILMATYYEKTRTQAVPYISKELWEKDTADAVIDFGQERYEKIYQKIYQKAQQKAHQNIYSKTPSPSDYDMIEYIYTGSLFNRILLKYNGCMLHSSAVVVDGYAYLFSADSGTGKSTHTQLWLKHFKDRAFIINDDKPALRCVQGTWYVYGTPWSGKTNLNVNTKVKLGAIVFLERAEKNSIEEISVKEAIPRFFNQTIRKLNKGEKMDLVLKNMESILTENPIYKMGCNISEDAVITAYEKIRRV